VREAAAECAAVSVLNLAVISESKGAPAWVVASVRRKVAGWVNVAVAACEAFNGTNDIREGVSDAAAVCVVARVRNLEVLGLRVGAAEWLAAKVFSRPSNSESEAACAEATARNLLTISVSDAACVEVARTD
jgi:hypothetical protein